MEMTNLIHYFGIFGKIALFALILWVIFIAVKRHNQPKVIEHNLFRTIMFNLIIIAFYAMAGILNTLTIGLICVLLFHMGDIVESIRKDKFVEFTVFNAYKSVPIMIFYFLSLYLTNYWSPMLKF
jgi:hypothetical protein